MSRKNDQVEEAGTTGGIGGGGGDQLLTFENGSDDTSEEQVIVQVELEHREEADNQNEVEKRQLLVVENAPPLSLQVISATCQSISSGGERIGSSGASMKKGDGHLDHQKQNHLDGGFYYYQYRTKERKSSVPNAFLTLVLVLFNLFWSVGLTYWHFQLNNLWVAVASMVIIVLSGSITSIAFFIGKNRKRKKSFPSSSPVTPSISAREELRRCSKVAWLLAAVPCLVPVILAGTYFISSMVEKRAQLSSTNSNNSSGSASTTAIAANTASGRNERRQCAKSNATTASSTCSASSWLAASGSFFLTESLTLCFPFCIMHLTILLENSNSIPSVIGVYTLFGLIILSFSITFSRFQYDCLAKPDRFGGGTEKYLRFIYLWSSKIIWLVTFCILVVSARKRYPGREIEATAVAIAGLTAIHEIPLWICLVPRCVKLASKLSGLFFLIPQFTALISLIYWVNTDPFIYDTNIGSIVLGLYFWSETVMLCGWLVDGNADKDIDLVPLYPHFFGDLISSCYPDEETFDSMI